MTPKLPPELDPERVASEELIHLAPLTQVPANIARAGMLAALIWSRTTGYSAVLEAIAALERENTDGG